MADGYDLYKKLVALKGGTTSITEDVYNRDPLDAWATLVGLKAAPLTKNIRERGQAAREAAELTERKLKQQRGY